MIATIHLQRKWHDKPAQAEYQRMSYDVTRQTEESLEEISRVLKEYSNRSNGEFDYWITGEPIEDGEYIKPGEILYRSKENERDTEDICALHSRESEIDTKGPAEGVQEQRVA